MADDETPKRKRGRPRKQAAEQLDMGEGFVGPKIPELEKAARDYVATRDERMGLTEEEVAANEKVRTIMVKHDLTVYRFKDGTEVKRIPGKEKVKVRRPGAKDAEEE